MSLPFPPEVLNELPEKFQWAKGLVSSFAPKVFRFFSKNKDVKEYTLNDEENEDIRLNAHKISRLMENPDIKQVPPELKKIFDNFDFFVENDCYKLVPRKIVNEEIVPFLKNCKGVEVSQKINIVPFSEGNTYNGFATEEKQLQEEVYTNILSFSSSLQSIFGLSAHAELLNSRGKKAEASNIRMSIKDTYGIEGLRLSNCYSIGYIKKYLNMFKGLSPKEIEKKIWELSKSPIFFTTSTTTIAKTEKIVLGIKQSMNKREPYIALHSLGMATDFAKVISERIENSIEERDYEGLRVDRNKKVGEDSKMREFSFIWHTAEGKEFYDVMKTLWV